MNTKKRSAVSAPAIHAVAGSFITLHGLHAFADEYYNLMGTKAEATITAKNEPLARALGLGSLCDNLPVSVRRQQVNAAVDPKKFTADRKALSAYFAARERNAVTAIQRRFLAWHFIAKDNYATNLPMADREVVVGWNISAEFVGDEDFVMDAFGICGCTILAAVAKQGDVHLSHWDNVANPAQIAAFETFYKRVDEPTVYMIGHWADNLAAALRRQHPTLEIYTHKKEKFKETNYSVRFSRENGNIRIRHAGTPQSADYIPSVHNGQYGRWFPHGRFSVIIPPPKNKYVETTTAKYEK